MIDRFHIRSLLDAPCGDYNWFRFVARSRDVQYLGGDVVKPLISRNQQAFGNASTRFLHLDILRDDLPDADLWICRDCLFHFSNADIAATMENFARSKIRYLLTSTHADCRRNVDVPTGGFRLLNLQRPPFNFCKPIEFIDDWVDGYPVKKLGLWERTSLAGAGMGGNASPARRAA